MRDGFVHTRGKDFIMHKVLWGTKGISYLLQRRFYLLQHVFDHIFRAHTFQDRRDGFQVAAILHASFVFGAGDGYSMRVDFTSGEGD